MTCDQVFLAAALGVFLATFVATMLYVRWRGYEPKGVMTNVKAWEAAVTTVATLLWLVVTLLYIFDARSVVWFGRIAFLDNDVAKGFGIVLSTVGVLVGIALSDSGCCGCIITYVITNPRAHHSLQARLA